MFTRVSAQKVEHTSGYVVQVLDRETIEYIDGKKHATINVDFGPTVGVFKHTLGEIVSGQESASLPESERERILGRIIEGLRAMGCEVEIC